MYVSAEGPVSITSEGVEETALRHGFRPTHHKLVIFGLSRASQESGADVPYRGITCPIDTT